MITKAKKPVTVTLTIDGKVADKATLRCSPDRAMWYCLTAEDPFLNEMTMKAGNVWDRLFKQERFHECESMITVKA